VLIVDDEARIRALLVALGGLERLGRHLRGIHRDSSEAWLMHGVALHDQRVVGLLHRVTHLVPLLLLHKDHVGRRLVHTLGESRRMEYALAQQVQARPPHAVECYTRRSFRHVTANFGAWSLLRLATRGTTEQVEHPLHPDLVV
jgi:hypothetical protein